MATRENNRTETEWVFLPDEFEEFDPEEYGEIRILEEGPQSVEEGISLGKAMEAAGIDTVMTNEWTWTVEESGAVPDVDHIDEHPFAETVAKGWTGGGMYTRLWGLSRIGDLYFQWYDGQTEFDPVCRGTLREAVEQSDYFRLAPTGHVVLAEVGDDEVVEQFDVEELGGLEYARA